MEWTNSSFDVVGYLPTFLNKNDPRPAVEQINQAYISGWNDFKGFNLGVDLDRKQYYLVYPDDPPMRERSRTTLRNEIVVLFEYDWVAVIQPSGAFKVARLD